MAEIITIIIFYFFGVTIGIFFCHPVKAFEEGWSKAKEFFTDWDDGDIRVVCHKQGLPEIYEATKDGFKRIEFCDDSTDYWWFDTIHFEYKGHKFLFESGSPYYAEMETPNGDKWECRYDYEYGAGWLD